MNFPSVSDFSIAKGTGNNPPEMYIPLWWYSGYGSSSNIFASGSGIGIYFPVKGSTSPTSSPTSSSKLFTINSIANPNTKYALELSFSFQSSGGTGNCQLYDVTSGFPGTAITSSKLSISNSTTMTVIRSGQFTLTPGHTYSISGTTSGGGNVFTTDVSLIVFPS